MLRTILVPAVLLLLSLPALAADPPATAPAAAPAFRPLFNGKDLSGWVVKCKPADAATAFWKVEDGAIVADSMNVAKHDYVWLCTDREYGDFVLRLKFQAFKDSPGNSGVQLRSRYDDAAGWLDGPQIDIHPPDWWRTGMMWDETRGVQRWIYPDVPKGKWVDESMAPKGLKFFFSTDEPAWNQMEITARGPRITATLNGTQVTDLDGTALFADAPHRQRRTGTTGFIALQIHSGDKLRIRFKDIEIAELNP